MSIIEIIRHGLRIARTHRSLWLFAFVVGLGVGGNGAGPGGGGGPGPAGGFGVPLAVLAAPILIAAFAALVVKFISEGALIEGVSRVHRGGSLTIREGFRAGWAHWGVLLRIAAIYVAANVGSLAILAAPCWLAAQLFGRAGLVLAAIPAAVVAVPWLVTLYMLQAFASRIAVLENRRAVDAIAKARLFLHGRLLHGLKLMVAAFVGPLVVTFAGIVVIAPVALLVVGALRLGAAPAVAIGLVTLLPALFVVVAFVGTVQSATWTLGYLTEAEH